MTTETILRIRDVMSRTGKPRSTIYHDAKNGRFPKPIKIGGTASGWLESEVSAYIAGCIAASRTSNPTP